MSQTSCKAAQLALLGKTLLLVVLFWSSPVLALNPRKTILEYTHDSWQNEEALQVSILTITQTQDGYLWMGTYEGLIRFNGVEFTIFDKNTTPAFKDHRVFTLFAGPSGTLWIGTLGSGLVSYQDGKFTGFTTHEGLSNNFVRSICQTKDGSLWIGTDSGLNRFQNGKFTTYTTTEGLASNNVTALAEDAEATLWIGTQKGLNCFKQGKLTTYTTQDGLTNNNIRVIYPDHTGNLWIGTFGGGLNCYMNGQFSAFKPQTEPLDAFVLSLCEDQDRNLWIGTRTGIGRLSKGKLAICTSQQGLSNDSVRVIFEDREGSLWVGTEGGLDRFKEGKVITYTTKHGLLNNYTKCICGDHEDGLWIGTSGGLSSFKSGVFHNLTSKDGLPTNSIYSLLEDSQGKLWIGTVGGGLSCFHKGTFTNYSTDAGLSNNIVHALCEDTDQGLWIGTFGGGLNYFKNGKFTVYTTQEGLTNNFVISLLQDRQGRLWIGTNGGGLNCLEHGKLTAYTTQQGLSNNVVFSLYEDHDGILWIGTTSGLNRFKDGKFTVYTTKEGLFSDIGFQILEDAQENLWITCNKGIFWVSKQDLNHFAQGTLQSLTSGVFGKSEGMDNRHCNGGSQPSSWKTKDGKLWFSTVQGIVLFDPQLQPKPNVQPPPVVIEKIVVDKQPIDLGSLVEIQPGKDKLEFHYAGLSFLSPEKVFFKVKLEGYDKDWIDKGTLRTAYYNNLPPRTYRFLVKACNNDGVWNDTGAHLEFTIQPHWYQTLWAYFLYVGGIAALGYGGFRYRVKALRRQNQKLQEQVKAKTAELGRLALAIQRTKTIITITDRNDEILWVNDRFTELTGYRFEEVRGKQPAAILRGPETNPSQAEMMDVLVGKQRPFESEIYNYHKDGHGFWVWVSAAPLYDEAAGFQGYISVQVDITEQKDIEVELEHTVEQLQLSQHQATELAEKAQEANRTKSVFFSNLSHELRTPLNAVLGFAQLMARDNTLNPKSREHLSIITRSGQHLLELINDVLSISKIEAGKFDLKAEPFDLHQLLNDLQNMFRIRTQAKGLQLVFRLSPSLPRHVIGDEGKLRQILINLLGNSVKFTDAGGVFLQVNWEEGRAFFEVNDTGQGMEEDELEKSFQPFEQTSSGLKSKEGTGLGLFISKNFIRLMGGSIQVKSKVEKGTTFSFDFPLPQAPESEYQAPDHRKVTGLAPGQPEFRLLVVDDKDENRMLLVRLLSAVGFQVRQAVDGLEAIAEWLTWHPHFIWMDMRMPVMDGYEATRQIRQKESESGVRSPKSEVPNNDSGQTAEFLNSQFSILNSRCKVIALTASAFEHDQKAMLKAGCDGFVSKPFNEAVIFDKLVEHLGIEFVYEEPSLENMESDVREPVTAVSRLAALPTEWVANLHQALTIGDDEKASAIADQIHQRDEPLAQELRVMIKNLKFDELLELLEKIPT